MMRRLLSALVLALAALAAQGVAGQAQMDINSTVLKMPLAEGVTMDDAIDSMKLRANGLNFKLVAHQPLWKELEAMGVESRRIEIFQFCDARIAAKMVAHNPSFAAYLPCRIALLEDESGKAWLITLNLDLFIGSADLPPDLQELAFKVRNTIASIMQAGANAEL